MRKILVTGGAGFIGSNLAEKLVRDPDNFVVVVDNFLTGKEENVKSLLDKVNAKIIKCDVNNLHDISQVMLSYSFDYVFHYAAVVGVMRTLENPIMVLNDIDGIKNILDLSKNTGVRRVFFSSSSEVYGEPVEFPQNEFTTPLNSRLPYAVVKNVGESFCRSYQNEFGLPFTVFRFFNTYGPRQSTDFVMSRFIRAALRNEDIVIYGDGTQSRTFCYIEDNIDAVLASFYGEKYINDVVNIGNDDETRIKDLAIKIIEITNSRSRLRYTQPLKEGDMNRRKPDIAKMRKLLNRPLLSLEEGIRRVIKEGNFYSLSQEK
jgi:UDP-glucose 4-epimerase